MTSTMMNIINAYDPNTKLQSSVAVLFEWDGEKFVLGEADTVAQYMKAMDGWVFSMHSLSHELGIDYPTHAVYDSQTLGMIPLNGDDFNAMKEM